MSYKIETRTLTLSVDQVGDVEGLTSGLRLRVVQPERLHITWYDDPEPGRIEVAGRAYRRDGTLGESWATVLVTTKPYHHHPLARLAAQDRGGTVMSDTRMHERIAKLLRKAERAGSEHEREVFQTKAEQLLLIRGLDTCQMAETSSYNPKRGRFRETGDLTIVGHASDADSAMWLAMSVLVQAQASAAVWWRAYGIGGDAAPRYRAARKGSFLMGFAQRVEQRLKATRTGMVASSGAELVLVSRADRVSDAFQQMFPRVRESRVNNRYYADAWVHGDHAGQSADIGQTRAALE